ncbi:long-chain-fatty-acid--CoA ligase [Burkholderia guangdongensis]|uniref:long-chain-fatty-acid--CoA ligase n=1 Tax=Burkholderia guangdongensis TaxID=1792500 RepID=UPI0015CA1B0E|nr:long-chain fatty acid--CoA ligase [Burkholderia guangdongensis]
MNDMPWIKSYPPGVRWDIDIAPKPVHQLLDDSAAKWPDRPALQFMGKRTTYAELQSITNRMAKGLQQLGVGPGVHVGLYLPNTPHYVVALFAIMKAGGTVVNYSPLDASSVLEHKIEDSQTDYLMTVDLNALYPNMAPMLDKTRLKKLIVGNVAEMSAAPDAVREQLRAAKQLADVPVDDRHITFAQLIDNDGDYVRHPVADPREALAVMQYTGGTTGMPKGAMLTHANLSSACTQAWTQTGGDNPVLSEGVERVLAVLPPFHIYALTVNMLFGILAGAEIIQHMRFEPKAILADIQNNKITAFCAVPTMLTALINDPDIGKYNLRSLKFVNSGGAPLPAEVGRRFEELSGVKVSEGWGMTETSPTGTFTPSHLPRKPGSCGIPSPRIEIRMLDVDDPTRYVPLGQSGELCIKGPNVMKGYWKRPDATADVTTFDGFMRTGDVAYMDDDGYVFIVDRTKDMLLCSGYNVYPRVLEEAIYQHPSVQEVAVIGVPDEYRGQSPKAFVVLKPGTDEFALDALQAFLKDKLGKHEMVQALAFRAELPKTPVGKISKKTLQEEDARERGAQA